MIEVKYTGSRGALRGISVECETIEQAEGLASTSTYWRLDGLTVSGHGSRADVERVEQAVNEINRKQARSANAGQAIERVMVPAGKFKIGDTLHGHTITGFGREFKPNSDHFSANGIDPWVETVCYAYFN